MQRNEAFTVMGRASSFTYNQTKKLWCLEEGCELRLYIAISSNELYNLINLIVKCLSDSPNQVN